MVEHLFSVKTGAARQQLGAAESRQEQLANSWERHACGRGLVRCRNLTDASSSQPQSLIGRAANRSKHSRVQGGVRHSCMLAQGRRSICWPIAAPCRQAPHPERPRIPDVVPDSSSAMQILLERKPQSTAEELQARDRQAPDSQSWAAVAALLSRKHERLDPTRALHLLPGQACPNVPCT